MALTMRPRDAETHSSLHFDISEGRMMDTACMFIVGNPFHWHLIEKQRQTFWNLLDLSLQVPISSNVHDDIRSISWRGFQMDTTVYTYIEVPKHSSVGWFNDWVHFRSHCTSEEADFCDLGGQILI